MNVIENHRDEKTSPHRHSPDNASSRWGLGFWSLVVTQFQGAFNDNALKFLVIYLIVDMGLADQQRDLLVLVIGGLFAVPFILFSMTGGYLADKFSKRTVTIGTKLMEVGVMAFALLALGRGTCTWRPRRYFCSVRRRPCSGHRSTACCRSCSPKKISPGATE